MLNYLPMPRDLIEVIVTFKQWDIFAQLWKEIRRTVEVEVEET